MQTISQVIKDKEKQYGLSFIPTEKTSVPEQEYDLAWDVAKTIVDGLTSDPNEALAKVIDSAIKTGIISEPELESRGAKSSKIITTISDLKYWGYLKNGSDSIKALFRVKGFECELIMHFGKNPIAFYVIFNNERQVCYQRIIDTPIFN